MSSLLKADSLRIRLEKMPEFPMEAVSCGRTWTRDHVFARISPGRNRCGVVSSSPAFRLIDRANRPRRRSALASAGGLSACWLAGADARRLYGRQWQRSCRTFQRIVPAKHGVPNRANSRPLDYTDSIRRPVLAYATARRRVNGAATRRLATDGRAGRDMAALHPPTLGARTDGPRRVRLRAAPGRRRRPGGEASCRCERVSRPLRTQPPL
jgi:hypothetical protein